MASKKRGLGRGLDALLGSSGYGEHKAEAAGATPEGALQELPVDKIQRGRYQPRSDIHADTLQELADSIRAQGVVQPVVVRPVGEQRYELIAGERRWRAAQIAGLHDIPAVVREVPDRAAVAMALIENIQRENLNPMEEARALQRLIDEFEMTHQQAAEAVGRSRTGVTNLLRLLELNEDVKAWLEKGSLEMGHARALLGLKGQVQSAIAQRVVERGLSVRETEQLVRRSQQGKPAKKPDASQDPNIRRLQEELADKLGAAVRIQHAQTGKGKLVIQYNSLDELDGILDHLR